MLKFRTWRNPNREHLKDVLPLDTPFNIHIDTSELCNMRCNYCGQSISPGKDIMSVELAKKIIDDARCFPRKIKLFDLYYTGEPLCNPNFVEILKLAKKSEAAERIGVTTNGVLLTPNLIDRIIDAGIDIIRISIQGLDSETYKKVCGREIDFNRFLTNLEYLYQKKKECEIKIKIADIALEGVENGRQKFIDMFENISDSIFIENIIPIYGDVEYNAINENIKDHAKNGRYGFVQDSINKVCYRPFIKLLVATNGNVSAACCDHISGRDIFYGNINTETLLEIWNGMNRKKLLKLHLEGKRFQHPLCKKCVVPNDIAYKEDLIDPYAETILSRM